MFLYRRSIIFFAGYTNILESTVVLYLLAKALVYVIENLDVDVEVVHGPFDSLHSECHSS